MRSPRRSWPRCGRSRRRSSAGPRRPRRTPRRGRGRNRRRPAGSLPLAQDGEPGQAGLEGLQAQPLVQPCTVVTGTPPLPSRGSPRTPGAERPRAAQPAVRPGQRVATGRAAARRAQPARLAGEHPAHHGQPRPASRSSSRPPGRSKSSMHSIRVVRPPSRPGVAEPEHPDPGEVRAEVQHLELGRSGPAAVGGVQPVTTNRSSSPSGSRPSQNPDSARDPDAEPGLVARGDPHRGERDPARWPAQSISSSQTRAGRRPDLGRDLQPDAHRSRLAASGCVGARLRRAGGRSPRGLRPSVAGRAGRRSPRRARRSPGPAGPARRRPGPSRSRAG